MTKKIKLTISILVNVKYSSYCTNYFLHESSQRANSHGRFGNCEKKWAQTGSLRNTRQSHRPLIHSGPQNDNFVFVELLYYTQAKLHYHDSCLMWNQTIHFTEIPSFTQAHKKQP